MERLRNNSIKKEQRRYLRKNQTDAEKKLWSILRNRQIDGLKFYRQYSIDRYILDFYCPSKQWCIEVDGGQHAEADVIQHDVTRTQYLQTKGIRIMRFWNNEVLNNIEGVFEKIVYTLGNVS